MSLCKSFRRSASSLDEKSSTSIIQFLIDSFNVNEGVSISEDLCVYFERLGGKRNSDVTLFSHTDLDKLVEQSSLLKESPEDRGSLHGFEKVICEPMTWYCDRVAGSIVAGVTSV